MENKLTNNIDNINGIARQPVECYSRVVGYFRPISNWNDGKKKEFADRKTFTADCLCESPNEKAEALVESISD